MEVKPLLMLLDVVGKGGTMGAIVVVEVLDVVLVVDDETEDKTELEVEDVAMLEVDVELMDMLLLLLLLLELLAQTAPLATTPNALLQFSGCPCCTISRPYSVPSFTTHGSGVHV